MSGGADSAGDDMVVGRTNESEARTILVAKPILEYEADFVLSVGIEGGWSSTKSHQGIDAIQATGAITEPSSGSGSSSEPAANGVVGRGLNGVVGYPHAVPRDRGIERDAQAGVFGAGGTDAVGIFGRGLIGVVGCEQTTPRDPTFETKEMAGVLGRGQTGVSGFGVNGAGIHGVGGPGVLGEGVNGLPGVSGDGGIDNGVGVLAHAQDAPALQANSDRDRAGVFQSKVRAQVWIIPLDDTIPDPMHLPGRADAGELCVTVSRDPRTNMRSIASLWFCTESSGPASTASWVKIA